MKVFLLILFILSAFLLLFSYVIYPIILIISARRVIAKDKKRQVKPVSEWPQVDLLMSVYNEEEVIDRKLQNILEIDYPKDRLKVWIGSDKSTDRTDEIVDGYARTHEHFHFYPFAERRGKANVINDLYDRSQKHNDAGVLLLTDASVLCPAEALKYMMPYLMEDPEMALVEIPIDPKSKEDDFGKSEKTYLKLESKIKLAESALWRRCMGVFGGFFLLKRKFYTPVPSDFAVDDFFIMMSAYLEGGRGVLLDGCHCWEPHSGSLEDEYRRKRRISRGNWKNFKFFIGDVLKSDRALSFSFIAHKVLRWLGPFLGIALVLSAVFLQDQVKFMTWVILLFLMLTLILPLVDVLLQKIGVVLKPLRNIRYFILMNVALLEGAIRKNYGSKGSIWDPPKRS